MCANVYGGWISLCLRGCVASVSWCGDDTYKEKQKCIYTYIYIYMYLYLSIYLSLSLYISTQIYRDVPKSFANERNDLHVNLYEVVSCVSEHVCVCVC